MIIISRNVMMSTAVYRGTNILEKSVASIFRAGNLYMRQHICGWYLSTKLHGITFHSYCNFDTYFINYMEVLSEINGKKKLNLNYHELLEEMFQFFSAIFLPNHGTLSYEEFTALKKSVCLTVQCPHHRNYSY